MSELVDRSIAELRVQHDQLAGVVAGLTEAQLKAPSGASEWTVADVLSHLGSGAEIGYYPVLAAATGTDAGAPENQSVWDRWNALSPLDQATQFVQSDARLVELYEGLSAEQRESVQIDLGFLPQPVPLATALGMRLNEQTLHSWDARVGVDPSAAVPEVAAELVLQHYAETMTFLLGFVGKAEQAGPARVALGDFTIVLDESVRLEPGTDGATATFEGPIEAGLRLIAGRLGPQHTPAAVSVSGNVTLDQLRKAFPGY
ncbi:MAG TPA: maleylpyruvate isomerase family mycothiol-dependent enzyme [Nocardioides sp.]|uniref:maleylpyruvate isomerase family mycothiol-dependent enzyme n=1 Tax=uncultured Nocardioides sp. TaxID=198441 RepID=UPI000EEE35C2|nr:maleylpyruvate isomerase family mycothiol-dependent enzyme [uncultured Nocardioides sp.]HCB06472.1 hypothetical protein [Nocardioides sp.]HRD63025.1 maleylpyruvate isomerase family mycothiol-dependent enzyme [Nocardioides sp.]HRI96004.1 maleylpyruvate isomerase family mycothiol-dependent enzyme [Nocardioides sp.]HRK45945.1 maleylpyruvate isomerase family mycothiol-dependent enzyme [Nocardioides sp.]